MLCEHANEVPAECKCEPDCYCKQNSCKNKDDWDNIFETFWQAKITNKSLFTWLKDNFYPPKPKI